MKPKWVATLDARKYKAVSQCVKNVGTVLLMSLLFLIISCDKSDDLEPIRNESPIDNESPSDNETPPDETPPVDEPPVDEPPADNETPPANETPPNEESNIIYTDIEPDFTSENLYYSYDLDLNNDGIIDFILTSEIYDDWEWFVITSPSNAGNGIISIAPWYSYAVPLNSDKEIFTLRGYSNGEFYDIYGILGDCLVGDQGCSYNWKDKVDKYLGLRFIINGQTHYGWARLDVTSLTQWVIKDYAYNATPNKPILAGQKN